MTLVFSEQLGNTRKFVHESRTSYKGNPLHDFGVIEMNSDVFEGELLLTRMLYVEAFELSVDKRGNRIKKSAGAALLKLRELLELEGGERVQVNLFEAKKKKAVAQLQFGEVDFTPVFSFLDYVVHRELNVVPMVAVDFSLANLTFDT